MVLINYFMRILLLVKIRVVNGVKIVIKKIILIFIAKNKEIMNVTISQIFLEFVKKLINVTLFNKTNLEFEYVF